jgi:transcriptional regulator with XRE-family HTH domain
MTPKIKTALIHERLRRLRKRAGYKQNEFARLARMSVGQIHERETGGVRIGAEELEDFAALLRVDVSAFYCTGKEFFALLKKLPLGYGKNNIKPERGQ